jgi:hypothetical protein
MQTGLSFNVRPMMSQIGMSVRAMSGPRAATGGL